MSPPEILRTKVRRIFSFYEKSSPIGELFCLQTFFRLQTERGTFGLGVGAGAGTIDVDAFGFTVAVAVEDTVFGGTFYFQAWVAAVKVSGVGNLAGTFFAETLAAGIARHFRLLTLYLDSRAAAEVVFVACTVGSITGQSSHDRTFFP